MPSIAAAFFVAVCSACSGVMPSATNVSSSRVFNPQPVYTASDPITIIAPALNARLAVSMFRPMKALKRIGARANGGSGSAGTVRVYGDFLAQHVRRVDRGFDFLEREGLELRHV